MASPVSWQGVAASLCSSGKGSNGCLVEVTVTHPVASAVWEGLTPVQRGFRVEV